MIEEPSQDEIDRLVVKELLAADTGGFAQEIQQAVRHNAGLREQLDASPQLWMDLLSDEIGTVVAYPEHTELETSLPGLPGYKSPKICVKFVDDELQPKQSIGFRLVLDRLLNSDEGYGVIQFGCPDPDCTNCTEAERGPHPRVVLHINGDCVPGHNPCLHISICAVCDRDDLDAFIDAGRGRLGSHVDMEAPGVGGGVYKSRGDMELWFQLDVETSRRSVQIAQTYYEPETVGSE